MVPKVSINDPLAARRRWPGLGVKGTDLKEVGSTEMSAPLSTRKEYPDSSSCIDMDPEDTELRKIGPGVIDARLWSFPMPVQCQVWR